MEQNQQEANQESLYSEDARERLGALSSSWGAHTDTYRELSLLLSVAVPLWVVRLLGRGGATAEDFKRVAGYDDELGRTDVVLYGSKKQGEIASFFNKLAEAIAVLSFCPGGIELFGQRYENAPLLDEWRGQKDAAAGKEV